MSEQPGPPHLTTGPASSPFQNATRGETETLSASRRFWKVGAVVATIMVILALVGVGLTTTYRSVALRYWMTLVPIYGLLCVATAWLRSQQDATFDFGAVIRQVVHWLGVGAAVALDFYVNSAGEKTGSASGLNALLLLAIGCFLAGVHLQWLFALVGALLALALICLVKVDQYLWLIFLVGGLLAVALFVSMRSIRLFGSADERSRVSE